VNDAKIDFYNHSRAALTEILLERFGVKPYRATQIFQWVYRRRIENLHEMSDLSDKLRQALQETFFFPRPEIESCQISNDGTRKYLFRFPGGEKIESVMIKQPKRMTLCVSSQVGCGMGCSFCRTATMGFKKHLSPSQIIQQVLGVVDDAKRFDDMFSNVVFMGMGEPLHNFNGIKEAIKIMTDQHGLSITPRRITVSTVGLVPAIKKFIQEIPVNLAVSLNATTDEVRSKIMPVNKRFNIAELLGSLKDYPGNPRRRVTIEYVMLSGVNDTEEDLKRLPKLLRNIPAKVNLIPYNENAGLGFRAPSKSNVARWQSELNRRNINVTVRWSKGNDISAACGQLATEKSASQPGSLSVL
jgi:23S rRNA (adenine2503-C2)-methyltransferase